MCASPLSTDSKGKGSEGKLCGVPSNVEAAERTLGKDTKKEEEVIDSTHTNQSSESEAEQGDRQGLTELTPEALQLLKANREFSMRLVEILQVKRSRDTFELYGHRIQSYRKASDGYGVLVVFEPSELDKDFQPALGSNSHCWFPSAKEL